MPVTANTNSSIASMIPRTAPNLSVSPTMVMETAPLKQKKLAPLPELAVLAVFTSPLSWWLPAEADVVFMRLL